MKIKIESPIFSSVGSKVEAEELAQILKYKTSVWREGPFSKQETQKDRYLVHHGKFLTGFIPRIIKTYKEGDLQIDLDPLLPSIPKPLSIPEVLPFNLESHQQEAIQAMLAHPRGVIHYPTASGKTIIFTYFLSLFPKSRALIIVNNQDLLLQTRTGMEKNLNEVIGIVGGGSNNFKRITVGMIQTLINIENLPDFDIIIVDEVHHVSKFSKPFTKDKGGSYARVLSKINAPLRYGFTGTLPYLEEAKWALEGYIGPVIAEKKMSEVKRVAKIQIRLKMLPITQMAKDAKTYRDAYKWSVVWNSRRHRQVLKDALDMVLEGRTVLILVTQVVHGNNILTMALRSFPQLRIKFVWGGVDKLDRKEVMASLNTGRYDVVIANAVWKEGVDIPTLGAIINAPGGKSEILTIQNLGRGLRTVPGIKDEVILYDYFDPSARWLVDHFGHRITLYFQEGWLGYDQSKTIC